MRPTKLISAWIPALTGLCLLVLVSRAGVLAVVLAALPGALMLSGGVRMLLVPDLRAPQLVAVGALIGIPVALLLALFGGGTLGLAVLLLSMAAYFAGGWFQIRMQPKFDDIPAPAPGLSYSAKVALDDAILVFMAKMTPLPNAGELGDAVLESETAHALFKERGWLDDPRSFHRTPPELESVKSSPLRLHGFDCEHLHYESGFEPDVELPGRDRWLGYRENSTNHVYVLRRKEQGPWLVCVHGFGMGSKPSQDFQAFRAGLIHERAGLNIALFTLPVHGPRSPGGFNGEKFMGLSVADLVHAESQAIWDLRRLIGWVRKQGATQVGVYGISLGAYTSAVLAGIEDGLACVIAGVPPTDVVGTREHLATSLERRLAVAGGVDVARDRAVHSVISPLRLTPRVEHNRRFIYAATGDQFVPIEQVRALWLHWEKPRISWCTGGHVSALLQREPRLLVDEAIATSFAPCAERPGATEVSGQAEQPDGA